jgi:hypothetical protein
MPTTENHVAALAAALNGIILGAVTAALESKPAAKTRPVKLEPSVAPPPEPTPAPEPEAIATPATVTSTDATADSKLATYTVPDVQALAGAASKVIGSVAVRDLIKEVTGAASIPAADAKTLPALAERLIAATKGGA